MMIDKPLLKLKLSNLRSRFCFGVCLAVACRGAAVIGYRDIHLRKTYFQDLGDFFALQLNI